MVATHAKTIEAFKACKDEWERLANQPPFVGDAGDAPLREVQEYAQLASEFLNAMHKNIMRSTSVADAKARMCGIENQ